MTPKKTVVKKASILTVGDTFNLFGTDCLIVFRDYNDCGQMVVRFVTDTSKDSTVSFMVVPHDFKFKIYLDE